MLNLMALKVRTLPFYIWHRLTNTLDFDGISPDVSITIAMTSTVLDGGHTPSGMEKQRL
jgi:hypothetical protein